MSKTANNDLTKEVSIFRTSVTSTNEMKILKPLLNKLVGSKNWNFDLEDRENILRIYYFPYMNNFLAREITRMGFKCEEIDN